MLRFMSKSKQAGYGFIKKVLRPEPSGEGLSTRSINCPVCDEPVASARYALGYRHCLSCGEKLAKERKHCVVPMPKSNYILVTDFSLLKGLNSSHKGGVA